MSGGAALSPGDRRHRAVRRVLLADGTARAGRVRARGSRACRCCSSSRGCRRWSCSTDVQVVQLVHPARGAVLPAHGEPDERRRHHRPTCHAVARHGRAPSREASRRSTSLLSIFFAGISGSSTADAASQGKIFIEAQVKEGYDLSFSIAITAVSAVLAVIIPPSILMIVWGGVLTVSIGALFLAGIDPRATARPRADGDRPRLREDAQLPDVPALDASGSAGGDARRDPGADDAVHHHRRQDLSAGSRRRSRRRSPCSMQARCPSSSTGRWTRSTCTRRCSTPASSSAVALFCVGTASASRLAARLLPDPEGAARSVSRGDMGIIGVGFFIAFVLPRRRLLPRRDSRHHHRRHHRCEPLARSVHMDPVHFAIIGIVSLAFGLVTPPYGMCLMISCAIAKVRLQLRDQGHDDHADADAVVLSRSIAGRDSCSCRTSSAGVPEVGARSRGAASLTPLKV